VIVPGAYVIISYELATGKKLWWVTGMAWQLKSVPIVDGDTIYISGWEIGGDPGQEKPPPLPFTEILAKHDANKDGVLSREEAPDPRMQREHSWNETDFDNDGVLDDSDWEFHIAKSTARNNIIAVRPQGRRGDISETGVLWRYRRGLPNTPSPLLYNNILWLVKDGGIATSLDPTNGRPIKQARLPDAIDKYWASPVAADGMVFVGSSYVKKALLAIRLDGAKGDITGSDRVVWSRRRSTPYVPSPLLYRGALYFLSHYQGVLTRVDAKTGKDRPGSMRLGGIRNVYSSPVAADGRVYVTDLNGTTMVISHAERPKLLARNRLDDSFSATAAIVGNEFYLRGLKNLYCIVAE